MSVSTARGVGTAPWLACRDLGVSLAHYRDVLGFRDDWSWTWGEPPDHAGVSRGRARILLVEDAERAERQQGTEVVIYVRDIDALHRELRASGARIDVTLARRPWGTHDLTAVDPDGHRLVFTEAPEDW